jgi:hypothetical protein
MLEAADDYVRALDEARRQADEAALPQVSASFFRHKSELASNKAGAAESAREAAVRALRAIERFAFEAAEARRAKSLPPQAAAQLERT